MLKSKIKEFLKDRLELELSEEKTKVTHMKEDRAKFLGTFITLGRTSESKVVMRKFRGRMERTRISQVRPKYYAPIQELLIKLEQNGFIKRAKSDENKLIPKAQSK